VDADKLDYESQKIEGSNFLGPEFSRRVSIKRTSSEIQTLWDKAKRLKKYESE
jgi:hypothetical protein